jgi:voltage-gated potassium channel
LVADSRFKYITSFYGLIDLLAILPFYLGNVIDLRAIRIVRMLRLFRILKFARYSRAIRRFRRAFASVKEELVVYFVATGFMLFLAATGIYYFEGHVQPKEFGSVFHCLWWSVVTLTTVGYGDVYPITLGGRIFTALVLAIGLGVVAVPSGLMASALTTIKGDEEGSMDQNGDD